VIHRSFAGDTFFPVLPPYFSEVSREEVRNTLSYSFIRYEREPDARAPAQIKGRL
jgi:hypothetical protein